MFSQSYGWGCSPRRWRKLRMREAARRLKRSSGTGKLRSVLAVLLGIELVVGLGQIEAGQIPGVRFLRREETCCVELVKPGDAGEDGQEVYGVRLRPDSLELQFYHRTREILTPK